MSGSNSIAHLYSKFRDTILWSQLPSSLKMYLSVLYPMSSVIIIDTIFIKNNFVFFELILNNYMLFLFNVTISMLEVRLSIIMTIVCKWVASFEDIYFSIW